MAVGKIEYKKILKDENLTPKKLKDLYVSSLKNNDAFGGYNKDFATDSAERYTIMTPEAAAALIASRQEQTVEEPEVNTEEIENTNDEQNVTQITHPEYTPIQGGIWPMTIDEQIPISYESVGTQPSSIISNNGSHVFKTANINVGNMQALLDEAAKYGIYFRITSGLRPGAKTKQGKMSHHAAGNAIDVTPIKGQTYADLTTKIRNSPEFVKWMREHGYGIYDETTANVMAKTGASGAHWHIGPDRVAIAGLDKLLA